MGIGCTTTTHILFALVVAVLFLSRWVLKVKQMTNRELLELAALAAGYSFHWGEKHSVGDCVVDCTNLLFADDGGGDEFIWNPLEDDGDAFRLMVNLNLSVRCFETGPVVDGCYISHGPERIKTNLAAATRLAIVKCAAEIGRGMKEQQ